MRTIDADAVIAALHEMAEGRTNEARKILLAAARVVHSATTINPEDLRPKGRWVEGTSRDSIMLFCSVCSEDSGLYMEQNYCPTCGAKMEV